MAQGDLSRKAPVMGRDQIGRLALTFNWMTDQLQALYADMREKVIQIQEARDAIAAKERHFRALIENATDLICIMNANGRIIYASPSVIRITGFSQEEVEGASVFNWFLEEDGKKLRAMLPKMLSHHGILRMADYRVAHKNGGHRILEMYGTNLLNDPVVGGFIINARDVTDRHKYMEELGRIEKLESIGVLAGGIAHDFNNMLTGILGNVSLARLHAKTDQAVTVRLKEAEKAILAARELTQQLLTFSGGGAPLTESASLDTLLKESVGFALSGGKVRCEYDLPGNLWPVEVDPGQIRQVVHNLVLNAVHAQGGMGVVRISAENLEIEEGAASGLPLGPGRYVVVKIEDEGHGIPEKNLARIFDPYFTTKKDGSGLGLAVTFQVIARHHGHIAVTSKPGVGSTFHVYLPASDDLPLVMKEVSTVPVSGRGERILVMDDEEAVLDVTSAMLDYMGFIVETARDGQEAVERYRRALERGEPFQVVMTDLNVAGGMGGKEAMQQILALDPRARGIVSSGYCHDPIMGEYSRYGFSGVIAKPYTPEKLFTVLEKILSRPDAS
ncbi:MAG: PAS domain S-box protein [Deltaproteobacteria bacterium]|nr:PAS domain S-box protein [Deltaproteobacteria bacterium]